MDATKTRLGADDALGLLNGIETLITARGKKVETMSLAKDRPTDDVLKSFLLGPTGNLRAPTFRSGKTIVVGFNEEIYARVLGG